MHSGKGLQVEVIRMIAKVMWHAFPKQAEITLELLKKEDRENLLRILTQQGELHKWAKKQGIKLEYEEIKILQEEPIESDEENDIPATLMGIHLHEVRKGGEHKVKSKITGKLRDYLERKYPATYQQIHAHVMSLKARALVGVLFTPGLLEDEIDTIIGNKGKGKDNETHEN